MRARTILGLLALGVVAALQAPVATAQQGLSGDERERALERFRSLSPSEQEKVLRGEVPESLMRNGREARKEFIRPEIVEPLPDDMGREGRDGVVQPPEPPSPIERRLNEATGMVELDVRSVRSELLEPLRQFGYELFRGAPTTFAPVTEIPVPVHYEIGPGDTIQINLYGRENAEYSLVVNREGLIIVPEIGPVNVAGLEFEQVRAELMQRVGEQLIGVNANVTLGRLRSMRVFILGDVRRPGSYLVSSLATLTNALFVSGGIKRMSSLRRVQLKRRGEVIGTLDLYDLLLWGDSSSDLRLRPGDVIFVPPIGPTVGVAGEVRRPAIYELNGEKRVAEAIALSDGLLATAHRASVQLVRISDGGSGREIVDINLGDSDGAAESIADGDVIRVYSSEQMMRNVVLLRGHVRRPGGYQWRDGMRITDLVGSAEALLPKPDLGYVVIRREVPPTMRVKALSVDLGKAFADPGGAEDIELAPRDTVLVFSADIEPEEAELEGSALRARGTDVPESDLDALAAFKGQPFEDAFDRGFSELEPRDALPKEGLSRQELLAPLLEELRGQARKGEPEQVVSVRGRVLHPGEYPLEPGMTVDDLIRAGGGLRQDAYPLRAELTRFVATSDARFVRTIDVTLSGDAAKGESAALSLEPFDTVIVKPVPDWRDAQDMEIFGEVRFPGRYTIAQDETLRDVLRRAGGLTDRAYPRGALFSRERLREREREELIALGERLRQEIAQASLEQARGAALGGQAGQAGAISAAQGLMQDLQTVEAVGRLVIDLPAIMDGRSNIVLQEGDRLYVPVEPQAVTVLGEVPRTTSHLYEAGLHVDDYIERSGGTTKRADKGGIYVVRADGVVITRTGSRLFRSGTIVLADRRADRRDPRPPDRALANRGGNLSKLLLDGGGRTRNRHFVKSEMSQAESDPPPIERSARGPGLLCEEREQPTQRRMLVAVRDEFVLKTLDAAGVPEQRAFPDRAPIAVLRTPLGGTPGAMVALLWAVLTGQGDRRPAGAR